MLIPSIDLMNGRIVQLVQGERLAIESEDIAGWVDRFSRFPAVQLIDLDAAMDRGSNDALVERICRELPCRVGGGMRTIERAAATLALGARQVIAGSALFRDDVPDLDFARRLSEAIGLEAVIGAVDARQGRVVVHGWRKALPLSPADAVRALEPYCGQFLYTHVDTEGLMQGIDVGAVSAVGAATTRRLTAAGGITTSQEIDALDAMGVDAVVGMAIYSGKLRT